MRRFTTGLVLAAGGLSRLGRPKQLLDCHGRTLLESGRYAVAEAVVDGPVPIVVDTWADDARLLGSS